MITMLWSGKGLTSFNKYNSANFLVKKKKYNAAFWGVYFLKNMWKKYFKNLILIVVLVLES